MEKPLKLVLKVGGSEVTELSTGSSGHDSSLFEDRSDHDKHKDRKRKKRKKGEKQAPGEEKGRKRRRIKVKGLGFVAYSPGLQLPASSACPVRHPGVWEVWLCGGVKQTRSLSHLGAQQVLSQVSSRAPVLSPHIL